MHREESQSCDASATATISKKNERKKIKNKLLWGLHTKITQCNIFRCVKNASQKPIQILGYQISLNKSTSTSSPPPAITTTHTHSHRVLPPLKTGRGPVCRAGFFWPRTHRHTHLASRHRTGSWARRPGWRLGAGGGRASQHSRQVVQP